jgi:high-affinity nickel permease
MGEFGFLAVLSLGFLLGLKHAIDADHVVAVSTIVSENKNLRKSSILGVLWGLGHTASLLIVGLVILAFKLTIPVTLALSMEFLVGVILVILGISITKEFILNRLHLHGHSHQEKSHLHLHSHKSSIGHGHFHGLKHEHKSIAVGMVHGLAGSAALTLLVLTTIDTLVSGVFYILIFGIGTIVGMMIVSTIIGLPFVYTANRFEEINEKVRLTAGFISIFLGIIIMVEIGFVQGLIYIF